VKRLAVTSSPRVAWRNERGLVSTLTQMAEDRVSVAVVMQRRKSRVSFLVYLLIYGNLHFFSSSILYPTQAGLPVFASALLLLTTGSWGNEMKCLLKEAWRMYDIRIQKQSSNEIKLRVSGEGEMMFVRSMLVISVGVIHSTFLR